MLLNNKVAVITGSNKGIGKKILEIFSMHGAKVFACVRKIDEDFKIYIKDLQNKTNNEIIPVKLDFNNAKLIKEASHEIVSKENSIDILVNNAAIIHTAIFQMTSIDKLKEIFETNFFNQSLFTQYILKPMIKKKNGSIIYISSSSGIDANEGRSAYSASKAALISQAKTLSRELGHYNIRVNSIAPGLTNTDMMKNNTSEKTIKKVLEDISLNRIADPEEIAKTVLFLASDLSSYITGQTLRVDGGMK